MRVSIPLLLLMSACSSKSDDTPTTTPPSADTDTDTDTDSDTDTDTDSDTDTDTDSDADTDTDSDTDTDTDSDTDTDTDSTATADSGATASTGATATTGDTADVLDGLYVGTLSVDAIELGFAVNYDQCVDKSFELLVDTAAVPQVTGTASCDLFGGFALQMEFQGNLAAFPIVEGTVRTSYPAFGGNPEIDDWTAVINGSSLQGNLQGDWQQGSAGLEWTADFDVAK